jgi:hypothetical protein
MSTPMTLKSWFSAWSTEARQSRSQHSQSRNLTSTERDHIREAVRILREHVTARLVALNA